MSEHTAARHRWDRRTAVLGVLAAMLIQVGATLLGDTPDTRDTTAEIARYFRTNRNSILAGSVVLSAGFVLVVGIGLTVARRLDAEGAGAIAAVLRAAAPATGTLFLLTLPLIYMTLSYVVATEAPEHAKPLFELSLVGTNIVAWPLAITFAATGRGLLRTALRSAFSYVSLFAAGAVAMATFAVARAGFLSPDVQQQVIVLSTTVWVAAAGFSATAFDCTRQPDARLHPDLAHPAEVSRDDHEWSRQ